MATEYCSCTRRLRRKTPTAAAASQQHSQQLTAPTITAKGKTTQRPLHRNNTNSSYDRIPQLRAQIKEKVSDSSCCAATALPAANSTQSRQLLTRRLRQKTPTSAAAPQQHSQQPTAPNHCSCTRADEDKRLRHQLLRRNNTPSSWQHPITAAAHAQTKAKDSDCSGCAATTLPAAGSTQSLQLLTRRQRRKTPTSAAAPQQHSQQLTATNHCSCSRAD
jgi:hypothetical protein